jgi:hypothetical protein
VNITIINPLATLLRQFYNVASWGQAEADYLKHHNLPMEAANAHCGGFFILPCAFDGSDLFTFNAGGVSAVVIEVYGDDDETVIDLAAWPVDRPENFATAMGAALLGAARVCNPASWFPGPLPIFRTPLKWLQARCQGVVVLDYKSAPLVLADALGDLEAEDEAHQAELRRLLCRPFVNPRNIVAPRMARRAA